MKREKPTTVLSFRVSTEFAEQVDDHIRQHNPGGNRQKLLTEIAVPALSRRIKRAKRTEQSIQTVPA